MSLAEELLADLDDGEVAEEDDLEDVNGLNNVGDVTMSDFLAKSESSGVGKVEEIKANTLGSNINYITSAPITAYAKLRDSERLAKLMKQLDIFSKQKKRDRVQGPVEADPEYQCIVEANNVMVEIDNEINVIHKYTKDAYSKCFPELESLVSAPLDYMKLVLVFGNDILEQSKQTNVLSTFLTPATIMVVSVTASTTQGKPLDQAELARVIDACAMAIELHELRASMLSYVESRMSLIAPNMSILVGASTAAKLMGHAGGLTSLSKMPACNIQVLGAQRRTMIGFSNASTLPHTGYLFHCPMVQKLPPDLRIKASRQLANKVTLAARVDSFHESQDGIIGERLLLEVEKKFDKWQEPPPVKQIKALPTPIEAPAKKRGGRRYRKMKERLGMSDLRRGANRMQFGEALDDTYQSSMGYSLGSLGVKGLAGRLRAPIADSKTRARVSKALQSKLNKYGGLSTMPTTPLAAVATSSGFASTVRRHGAASSTTGSSSSQAGGTASSIAFTPLQGLEIVNPQAAERQTDEGNRYFSSTSGFTQVQPMAPPRSKPNVPMSNGAHN